MKWFTDDMVAYAFFGMLVTTGFACLLIAFLNRDANGAPMALPRCNEARSLDQVRVALEEQGGRTVLGLYAASETQASANRDYRRCSATVVTRDGEAPIGFTIGWHDRRNGIPFWMEDGL